MRQVATDRTSYNLPKSTAFKNTVSSAAATEAAQNCLAFAHLTNAAAILQEPN